jgi:hypothetical protein
VASAGHRISAAAYNLQRTELAPAVEARDGTAADERRAHKNAIAIGERRRGAMHVTNEMTELEASATRREREGAGVLYVASV